MNLEELKARMPVLVAGAQKIRQVAEDEKRDFSVEESAEFDGLLASVERTKADIDRLEKLNQQQDLLTQGTGRRTQPAGVVSLDGSGEGDVQLARRERRGGSVELESLSYVNIAGNWNFKNLGDFALSVQRAAVRGGMTDRRLELSEKLAAASTYGNEGAGADGGFAVPPEFRTAVMVTILGEDSLLSRCDQVTCQGNFFVAPIDESTPWQTSGGILANWEGEASAATQSKPQLGERTIKLNKLRCLVPMTSEVLEDASALDSYLRRKAPDKIAFAVNKALVQGTGVGMPLGILASPAKVQVAKEGSQVANTIVGMNILKMYNRMYAPSRSSAVWLINQEVEPQLFKLSLPGTDNTGAFVTTWGGAIWMPAGGVSGAPYATLFGRPVIPTQACPALSSEGDIIFTDFSQYLALLKSGPNPRVDVSMHLWFDQDLVAYKFVLRMGGMPWWSVPATPLAGSNTYSPIVTLQAR